MEEYLVLSKRQYSSLCNKVETKDEKTNSTTDSLEDIGIKGLPKYSLPLYEYLKAKSPSIDWNSNNDLLVSGVLVPDSNILTLFKDPTNPKSEKIQSNLASWRVFKNWLVTNNVPTNLVNNNVTEEEKLPEIQNPAEPAEFPSIAELKNKDEPLIVNSKEKPSPEDASAVNNSEKKEKQKVKHSSCVIKPPKRYSRGATKKIKWIRF